MIQWGCEKRYEMANKIEAIFSWIFHDGRWKCQIFCWENVQFEKFTLCEVSQCVGVGTFRLNETTLEFKENTPMWESDFFFIWMWEEGK